MPTATARKTSTTPRKRRTRKATAKSTPLNTTVETKLNGDPIVTETVKEVKVDVQRRNLTELNGLELVILPLVYLEGFVKLILKETGVLQTV
tara:strand:- start:810 stop:1085 length:276 start_codon:yes stop_codon:yes gene_type:complete